METQLVSHTSMTSFELLQSKKFAVGFFTRAKNPDQQPNEDSLGIVLDNSKAVLVVADGVGGAPKGEEASQTAVAKVVKHVSKFFANTRNQKNIRVPVLDGIEAAQEALISNSTGARTTLITCAIDHHSIRAYQVGDSGMIVCGQKGSLKYKANEHAPVSYLCRSGFISEEQALAHPSRNIVANLVGEPDTFIEIGPTLDFAPNDTVLLATDGVFDNFTTEQLIEIIRKDTLSDVMTQLVTRCQHHEQATLMKEDDISFIVCRHIV